MSMWMILRWRDEGLAWSSSLIVTLLVRPDLP
jgi:hypothetical protein